VIITIYSSCSTNIALQKLASKSKAQWCILYHFTIFQHCLFLVMSFFCILFIVSISFSRYFVTYLQNFSLSHSSWWFKAQNYLNCTQSVLYGMWLFYQQELLFHDHLPIEMTPSHQSLYLSRLHSSTKPLSQKNVSDSLPSRTNLQ